MSDKPGRPNLINVLEWSLDELNVPVYPEPRIYKNTARYICTYLEIIRRMKGGAGESARTEPEWGEPPSRPPEPTAFFKMMSGRESGVAKRTLWNVGDLLVRDLHLDIAARRGRIHGGGDFIQHPPYRSPASYG